MNKLLLFGFVLMSLMGCEDHTVTFAPPTAPPVQGIGIAVLVDISGSMSDTVSDNGKQTVKEEIARHNVINVIQRCQDYAKAHPNQVVKLGVIKFDDQVETVVPFDKPSVAAAQAAVDQMQPRGDTAIGDAIIEAKKQLDATGLTSKHVVVVTDGANNQGTDPIKVAEALNQLPKDQKTSVYVIAFDVNDSVFSGVKQAGWSIFSASNAGEVQQCFDVIFGEDILLEK